MEYIIMKTELKTKPIMTRLSESQFDGVLEVAQAEDRKVSAVVRLAVNYFLRKRNKGTFRKLFSFIF